MLPDSATTASVTSAVEPVEPNRLRPEVSTQVARNRSLTVVWSWIGIRLLIIAVLLVLTYFNLNHSTELEQAELVFEKDNIKALQRASDRLEFWPPSPRAEKIVALSLTRLGYGDLAEPHFARAGKLTLKELHARAFGLVRVDRIDEAIKAYQDIMKVDPTDVQSLRQIAALYLRLSQWEEALGVANRLIALPGGKVIGYTLKGQVDSFINPDDPKLIVEAFEKVLELDPNLQEMPLPHSLFWSNLANALLNIGAWKEAETYLIRGLSERDANGRPVQDAELMDLLGSAYRTEGNFEEAVNCWRRSIEWDPKRSGPWLDLGRYQLKQGLLDDALASTQKAVELAPDSLDPRYLLTRIYRRLGRMEDAEVIEKRLDSLRSKAIRNGQSTSTTTTPAAGKPKAKTKPR